MSNIGYMSLIWVYEISFKSILFKCEWCIIIVMCVILCNRFDKYNFFNSFRNRNILCLMIHFLNISLYWLNNYIFINILIIKIYFIIFINHYFCSYQWYIILNNYNDTLIYNISPYIHHFSCMYTYITTTTTTTTYIFLYPHKYIYQQHFFFYFLLFYFNLLFFYNVFVIFLKNICFAAYSNDIFIFSLFFDDVSNINAIPFSFKKFYAFYLLTWRLYFIFILTMILYPFVLLSIWISHLNYNSIMPIHANNSIH